MHIDPGNNDWADGEPSDDALTDLMMGIQRVVLQAPAGQWSDEVVTSARTVNAALAQRLGRPPV